MCLYVYIYIHTVYIYIYMRVCVFIALCYSMWIVLLHPVRQYVEWCKQQVPWHCGRVKGTAFGTTMHCTNVGPNFPLTHAKLLLQCESTCWIHAVPESAVVWHVHKQSCFHDLMLHRRPKERAAELGEIHIVDVPHISREHADHDASHIEDWHQILPIARQRIQQEDKYAVKVKWPFASGVHSVSKTHWSIVQTFNYYYTHPASWRRLYQWQWQPSNSEAHQTVPGKTHGANQNGNTHEESALLHHRACPYLWDTPHSRQIMHQTLTHSLKRPNAKVSSDFDSL